MRASAAQFGDKRMVLRPILVVIAMIGLSLAGMAREAEAVGPDAVQHLAGCTANVLPSNDDGSTDLVDIGFNVNYFGTFYSQLYVNNNGNVTFDEALGTFTPFGLTGSGLPPIIAPFFADVDTRNAASGVVTYGQTTVDGRDAFCVLWDDVGVGYYNSQVDKLNMFQLLLVDRSNEGAGDFDIIFNYDQIQWETGSASGGTAGLGGDSAAVGYTDGSGQPGTNQELPGSLVPGSFLDGGPNALIAGSQNSLQAGRYVFPVRGGLAPTGGTVHGTVTVNPPVVGALVQICDAALQCVNAVTNSVGNYSATGLPPGQYDIRVFAPGDMTFAPQDAGPGDLTQNGSLEMNVHVEQANGLPNDVEMEPLRGVTSQGIPVIFLGDGIHVRKSDQCPGAQVWFEVRRGQDLNNDGLPDQIAFGDPGFNEFPNTDGTSDYADLIPSGALPTGNSVWVVYVDCPPHAPSPSFPTDPDNIQIWNVYIDPSGVVIDTQGDPIDGATVTLFRSEDLAGPFDPVPNGSAVMSPSNRANPDLTDAAGRFGWDTISGFYKVRAEKAGCVDPNNESSTFVETGVLPIPPPVTDLELVLDCGEAAADADGDQVLDDVDNCPNASNPNQENNDGDGSGDACDLDDDNDNVADSGDNCQFTANADQRDTDGDGIGDVCDPTPSPAPCTITGTEGNDVINGTNRSDVICGLGGNDRILGGNSDDVLVGGQGDDTLLGGNGEDSLHGGNGADSMSGENGVDLLNGDAGPDSMSGGNGGDVLLGGDGNDILNGDKGADILNGEGDADTITGGQAKDRIDGGLGTDACSELSDIRVNCP